MSEEEKKKSRPHQKAVAGLSEMARNTNPASALPLLGLAAMPLHRKMMSDPAMGAEETEALLDKLHAAMKRRPDELPLDWNPKVGPLFGTRFEKFKPVQEILGMPPGHSASTIAHEMGHAYAPTKLEGALKKVSPFLRHPVGIAAPSLLALSGALSPKEELPIQAKAAPYIGALQLAAIIGEEARANIRGNQLLSAVGNNVTLRDKLKSFAPTLSYLALAAPLIAAPIAINKGLRAYEKSRQRGKDVSAKRMFLGRPSEIAELPAPEEIKEKYMKKTSATIANEVLRKLANIGQMSSIKGPPPAAGAPQTPQQATMPNKPPQMQSPMPGPSGPR